MEWSDKVIMEFLDLYEKAPVIWDPKHEHHKDREKVYDAWKQILRNISIECSLKELKKQKEKLMVTYRKLTIKVKKGTRTGTGTNESYQPKWFAYEKMASFLHSAYTPRKYKIYERPIKKPDRNEDDLPVIVAERLPSVADPLAPLDVKRQNTTAMTTTSVKPGGLPIDKKRADNAGFVEKHTNETNFYLKQSAATPKLTKDESSVFCELLCLKLRALDDDVREVAMHEINNLMFRLKHSRAQPPNALSGHHHLGQQPASIQLQYPAMNQHRLPVDGPHHQSRLRGLLQPMV